MEVIRQVGWTQVQETVFISNLGRRPGLSLATHLAINNSGSNITHESRHEIGNLIASHVAHVLDTIGYALEFVLDLFQCARGGSIWD